MKSWKSGLCASLALVLAGADGPILLDTHVIVWMASGDPRLNRVDQAALSDPLRPLVVSVVAAYEFVELQRRGRLAITEPLDFLCQQMDFEIEGLPADCWQQAAGLPQIHRDPIDRMLVAHAMSRGFTLATADSNIRKYPVRTI